MKRSGRSDGAGKGNNFFRPDILAAWLIYHMLNYIYRTVIMPAQNAFRIDEIDTRRPFERIDSDDYTGDIFTNTPVDDSIDENTSSGRTSTNTVVEIEDKKVSTEDEKDEEDDDEDAIEQQVDAIGGAVLDEGGNIYNGGGSVLYADQDGYVYNITPRDRDRGLIVLVQLAEYIANQERIRAEQNAARFELLPDGYVDGDNIPGAAIERVENIDQQIVAVENQFPVFVIDSANPAMIAFLGELNGLIDYQNIINPIVVPGELQARIYRVVLDMMAQARNAQVNALDIEDAIVEEVIDIEVVAGINHSSIEDDQVSDSDFHVVQTRGRSCSMVDSISGDGTLEDEDSSIQSKSTFRIPLESSMFNQANTNLGTIAEGYDESDDHIDALLEGIVDGAISQVELNPVMNYSDIDANPIIPEVVIIIPNAAIAILLADNSAPEPVLLITNGETTFGQAIGFIPMDGANDEDSDTASVIIEDESEVAGGASILNAGEEL